jgi:hypothetical protein
MITVVVVASGGLPVVNVTTAPPQGALPATVVTALGIPVTIASNGSGIPMTLLNPNGTPYS